MCLIVSLSKRYLHYQMIKVRFTLIVRIIQKVQYVRISHLFNSNQLLTAATTQLAAVSLRLFELTRPRLGAQTTRGLLVLFTIRPKGLEVQNGYGLAS